MPSCPRQAWQTATPAPASASPTAARCVHGGAKARARLRIGKKAGGAQGWRALAHPAATLGALLVAGLFTLLGPAPSTSRPGPNAPPAGTAAGVCCARVSACRAAALWGAPHSRTWPRIRGSPPLQHTQVTRCTLPGAAPRCELSGQGGLSCAQLRNASQYLQPTAAPGPFTGGAGVAGCGPPWRLLRTTSWSEVRLRRAWSPLRTARCADVARARREMPQVFVQLQQRV